jgi:hypothetical protein
MAGGPAGTPVVRSNRDRAPALNVAVLHVPLGQLDLSVAALVQHRLDRFRRCGRGRPGAHLDPRAPRRRPAAGPTGQPGPSARPPDASSNSLVSRATPAESLTGVNTTIMMNGSLAWFARWTRSPTRERCCLFCSNHLSLPPNWRPSGLRTWSRRKPHRPKSEGIFSFNDTHEGVDYSRI